MRPPRVVCGSEVRRRTTLLLRLATRTGVQMHAFRCIACEWLRPKVAFGVRVGDICLLRRTNAALLISGPKDRFIKPLASVRRPRR